MDINYTSLDRIKKSGVIWLTGLSGAGKTTLAHAASTILLESNCRTYVLDGDNLRHGLCSDLGFSAQDRKENIRRAAHVAQLFHEAGHLVFCAFISPFAADRAYARSLIPPGDFLEIHVRCPFEECARRDPKGLYAKVQKGLLPDFTGKDSAYEAPISPELTLDTHLHGIEECALAIVQRLRA